jgi:hypothetical protein
MQGQHENSKRSFAELDVDTRRFEIYKLYREHGIPLTDRDVMQGLLRTDMNEVRPRITELIRSGYLYECGRSVCRVTGRSVRICKAYKRRRRKY